MLRSYETVSRDVNHPSIIGWSIGNEDPLTSLYLASIRTVKELDPSRPVLMPWRTQDGGTFGRRIVFWVMKIRR